MAFFHTYLFLPTSSSCVCLIIKYPILLLTYLPIYPLLFIFSTCKSSAEVVTIEPSTIPVDGSNSTLVRVGPVETSREATDATVEESTIIETTALIPPTNVFNSTEGVIEHKVGWYMIYAGRSTISKAADLIELSPLVELTATVNTLFIFTTEVEPEALSITYYPRTSVAGKAPVPAPVPAPANLQELGLGRSLKILGEVKVFVFIFGVHVGGIENIVVFRRVEEGVSGDSCGILR